jgi:DNA-binding transcriptional LysR family regulator
MSAMRNALLSLELRDIHILAQLLQDGSVSRVAEREGISQPGVSKILRRLREALGDSLLVKSGGRMVLTERAEALREPAREILGNLAAFDADAGFDPRTSRAGFQIGCSDCVAPSLIRAVIEGVTGGGRRMGVKIRMIDGAFNAALALETGQLDIIIDNYPRPREDLRTTALYSDEVVCLMRKDHPLAAFKRIGLAKYLNARHLGPNASVAGEQGPISRSMHKAGYKRNIAATTPEYGLVPHLLLGSDLLFTTGRRFALEQARHFPLAVVGAPAEFEALRFYQLWHPRRHDSKANRWLREVVRQSASS